MGQRMTAVVGNGRYPIALTALFDLSRTRQALLSVAQPALGALIALGGLPDARTLWLGLVAASTGFLAVFSLNDVLDRRVDERAIAAGKSDFEGFDLDTGFARHPLARGDISLPIALGWIIALAVLSAIFAYLLAPMCLLLFGTAVKLEFLYCKLGAITWLKTFVSGAMVGVGGLAGWAAVAPLDLSALPLFTFLATWEIAGRNLPNDLSDVDADRRAGTRTVATVFGPVASSRAIAAGALATTGAIFLLQLPVGAVALSSVAAMVTMTSPAIGLVRDPCCRRAADYFNRASLLPALMLAIVVVAVGWPR